MHCGDRARDFVELRGALALVARRRDREQLFHDCQGCDFIHGRFGTDLTIRGNRFDALAAVPAWAGTAAATRTSSSCSPDAGCWSTRNHFGVYREGGAQLYLTNNLDYATIVNNVFVGTDPRVPGYHARMGIVDRQQRVPAACRVRQGDQQHDPDGHRRRDGYAGSLRMSSRYGGVQRWKRPIVANNVIALLETPGRVCLAAQRFINNVVIQGKGCSEFDLVGPADLDGSGRPRADSTVIDGANRHYAPRPTRPGSPAATRPTSGRSSTAAVEVVPRSRPRRSGRSGSPAST